MEDLLDISDKELKEIFSKEEIKHLHKEFNEEFRISPEPIEMTVNGYPRRLNFPIAFLAIGTSGFMFGPVIGLVTTFTGLGTGILVEKLNI